ncbi:hypothetical protein J1614_011151 [Plenodomus biglobosus]|nr:hypothetical protein J1614_011151 [Plenodomus biglobosus]
MASSMSASPASNSSIRTTSSLSPQGTSSSYYDPGSGISSGMATSFSTTYNPYGQFPVPSSGVPYPPPNYLPPPNSAQPGPYAGPNGPARRPPYAQPDNWPAPPYSQPTAVDTSSSPLPESAQLSSNNPHAKDQTHRKPINSALLCPRVEGTTYESECGAQYSVECDSDRHGLYISKHPVFAVSLEQCIKACDDTPGCVDVSYINGTPGPCFLKSTFGERVDSSYIVGARQVSGCKSANSRLRLHRKRVAYPSGRQVNRATAGPGFTFTSAYTATKTVTTTNTVTSTFTFTPTTTLPGTSTSYYETALTRSSTISATITKLITTTVSVSKCSTNTSTTTR